ncbi:MAG TPA: glycerophosphodiester phosphodiesterase [Vicinamibacteria bacterium]|nr:glycerophosphodiester phosphodiesterase [Vicinamibacteria bacterium]
MNRASGLPVVSLLVLLGLGGSGYGGVVPARPFDLQGHRGARGLRPENTLPAFAEALSLGVSTLELDLAVTRDGVLVVGHDPRLSSDIARDPEGRFVPGPGPAVFALTFDELQRYDVGRLRPGSAYAARFPGQRGQDGVRMPRLADVFDLAERAGNRGVRFNVEIKVDPRDPEATPTPVVFADAVVALVRARGLSARVTIQSFDWRSLARVREVAPEIERSCLTSEQPGDDTVQAGVAGPKPWLNGLDPAAFGGSVPRLVAAAGCQVWSPDFRDASGARASEAHALGLTVLPWTLNESADMERLIDLGADGMITDYPDRLRAVLAKRGLPLPPATPIEP